MILDENGEVVNLDYESSYKQFSEEKRNYKEQLHSVIIGCTILEFSINYLCETKVKKLPSTVLKEWASSTNVPISVKLNALRFADLISEELFKNIKILFKIRNKFAHDFAFPSNTPASGFSLLKNIDIGNDFVKNLSNDSVKFQIIINHCCTEFLFINKKLDPTSVMNLEMAEGTTFEEIDF
jgi:hypothetical protein